MTSSVLETPTNDWNNDVVTITFSSTQFFQPQTDAKGIGQITVLALTFTNYIPPTSTEALGACATAADVASKKCFSANFKF